EESLSALRLDQQIELTQPREIARQVHVPERERLLLSGQGERAETLARVLHHLRRAPAHVHEQRGLRRAPAVGGEHPRGPLPATVAASMRAPRAPSPWAASATSQCAAIA